LTSENEKYLKSGKQLTGNCDDKKSRFWLHYEIRENAKRNFSYHSEGGSNE